MWVVGMTGRQWSLGYKAREASTEGEKSEADAWLDMLVQGIESRLCAPVELDLLTGDCEND